MNNAYSAGEMLFTETIERPFWEAPHDPATAWDACNNVGLRNHYLCTVYASRFNEMRFLTFDILRASENNRCRITLETKNCYFSKPGEIAQAR